MYVGHNIHPSLVHFDPIDEGSMFLQNFPMRLKAEIIRSGIDKTLVRTS